MGTFCSTCVFQFLLNFWLFCVGNTADIGRNFTLVIVAVNGTTLYADMRLIGPGMQLAIEEVRQTYPSLRGFEVAIWHKPFQTSCDNLEYNVADTAAKMYYDRLQSSHPVSAFLGTTCTYADKQLLDLLYYWNLPLMEGSSLAAFIADRKRYPLAMGFSYNQMRAGEFFYKVLRTYSWTIATGLYDSSDAIWRGMYAALDYFKEQSDVRLESMSLLLTNITQSVHEAHQRSRVSIIMANPGVIREMMIAAYRLGYTRGDHIYIAAAYFKTKYYFGMPQWRLNSTNDQIAKIAFQSLLLVKQHVVTSEKYHQFELTVQKMSEEQYHQSITPDDEVNIHSMAFHDAILAYAEVVNETLTEGDNIFDGRQLLHRFTNRTFSGIRGNFTLDGQNNVPGHFELWNFRQESGEFVKVLDFPDTALNIEPVDKVVWASGYGPPTSQPFCWFDDNNPACYVNNANSQILYWLLGLIGGLVIVTLTSLFVRRTRKARTQRRTLAGWQLCVEHFVAQSFLHRLDDT